jgi:hypothetical protein
VRIDSGVRIDRVRIDSGVRARRGRDAKEIEIGAITLYCRVIRGKVL